MNAKLETIRGWVLWISLGVILALFLWLVTRYQRVIDEGTVFYLELAPVDPRSVMQGDYMLLAYEINRDVNSRDRAELKHYGTLIVTPNSEGVGEFVRIDDGSALSANEYRLHYGKGWWRWSGVSVRPESYLFQEGHASYYEDASYGVFKGDENGLSLLFGLADENFELIEPNPK